MRICLVVLVVLVSMWSCELQNKEEVRFHNGIRSVIAIGNLGTVDSLTVPGMWVDGVWHPLPVLSSEKSSAVRAVEAIDSAIYSVGYSTSSSNHKVAGLWKDNIWSPLDSESQTNDSEALSILWMVVMYTWAGICLTPGG